MGLAGGALFQEGAGLGMLVPAAGGVSLLAAEDDISIRLRAFAPRAAYAGCEVLEVAVGAAVGVYPVVYTGGAFARVGALTAADGIQRSDEDSPVGGIQVAQHVHDGGTAVAVANEDEVCAGVSGEEGAEVTLNEACAVPEEAASAAVPSIEGAHLFAGAGDGRCGFIHAAQVGEHLLSESADEDDGHVRLFRGEALLEAAADEGGIRRGVDAFGGRWLLLAAAHGAGQQARGK